MLHPARKAVLKSQKRSQSDPTTSTISVDAILFQSVRVPEEDLFDDVHKLCESALATSASEATVDHCVDPLRWGNSQGLSVLEKLDLLTSDVKSLKDETTSTKTGMANLETEIADLKTEIADLNAKINILAPESTSYLAIRNRFFSTYRRDILGSTNSKDRDAVPFGNKKAHAGDIITDRRLYENGTRFDDEIFEDLYGIHWARVHQIGKIFAVQKIVAI